MNTFVIVVTYEPDRKKILKIAETLKNTECEVVLVDNSEKYCVTADWFTANVHIIRMEGNEGIAKAQNVGVAYALSKGADILGFFDQDSDICDELVQKLLDEMENGENKVVVPVSIDAKSKREYPSRRIKKSGMTEDIFALDEKNPIRVHLAISSGTFMTRDVFEVVGEFDEDLFIDFVDVEWCIRCFRKQVPIYVIPNAVLEHRIGKKNKNVMGLTISVHSPYRTYYKVRNSFLLLRKKRCSFWFALRQILPAIAHNFFLLFGEQGKEYFKYYIQGICDGIIGKTGRYDHRVM